MATKQEQKAGKNAANKKRRKLELKPQNDSTPEIKEKPKQKKPKPYHQSNDPILFGPNSSDSSSSSDADDSSTDVQNLLEPFTKDQLVDFLCDAALADPSLLSTIRSVADCDVSHRKVFVHGFAWDVTRETLVEVFSPFGSIEDCNVVVDKATGRARGYGFVLFKTSSGAAKALADPQKKIKNQVALCQLASTGPTAPSAAARGHHADTAGRKIYVSNVHQDADPDKLKAFFAKFGVIETGPQGFDTVTGKSRGFALFVYKSQEAARRVLEEPYKMFEGHQLHCQWATEPSKGKVAVTAAVEAGLVGPAPQPVLAAVAAAQNLALYSQNPAYGVLLAQNPLLAAAAALNPGGLNAAALNSPVSNSAVGAGLVGYGGSPSVLGAFGAQGGLQGTQYGTAAALNPGGLNPAALNSTVSNRAVGAGLVGYGGSPSVLGAFGAQGTTGLQGTHYGTAGLQGTQHGTAGFLGTQYGTDGLQRGQYGTAGLQGSHYGTGLQGSHYGTGLQGMQYGQSQLGRQGGSYGGMSSYLW